MNFYLGVLYSGIVLLLAFVIVVILWTLNYDELNSDDETTT